MSEKIAVFTDKYGQPADFYLAEKLTVFIKQVQWCTHRIEQLEPIISNTVGQIRKDVMERQKLIKDCKIVVAKELSGIAFANLDMSGYCIFTADNISDELLDGIIIDCDQWKSDVQSINLEKPQETSDIGHYAFNLIAAQTLNPEISSKKALNDFLENTPFIELRLKCSHIPPWIEKIASLEIINVSQTEFIVRKKQCS